MRWRQHPGGVKIAISHNRGHLPDVFPVRRGSADVRGHMGAFIEPCLRWHPSGGYHRLVVLHGGLALDRYVIGMRVGCGAKTAEGCTATSVRN